MPLLADSTSISHKNNYKVVWIRFFKCNIVAFFNIHFYIATILHYVFVPRQNMFRNPFDEGNVKITRKVKEWVTTRFMLSDSDIIMVMEVKCIDPNCPDYETKITILKSNGQNANYKIRKPLTFVRKWDIDALITE